MNWVRNYFTPLTLLCSARHAGATPYGAAPSSGALHLCPPWQPTGPHPAVQRLRARRCTCNVQRLAARRCTCNVQRLAARRCTVTYMQTRQPSPAPPSPLAVTEKRAAAICTPPLNPLSQILPIRRFGPCICSPIHRRRYSPPIPFFLSIENMIF